ncbi:MAG: hypothetical protein HC774_04290 [Sphingomonadales bacterium]|nr:hypothetical protein [Sphingomonadales bacterium]
MDHPFLGTGAPKPVVIVGRNGSGNPRLLSMIADALLEAAAIHCRNAIRGQTATPRPRFSVVGGKTMRPVTGASSRGERRTTSALRTDARQIYI